MDKTTPNKRKSLANTNTTPIKIQKAASTPVSQKNKSPKSVNRNQKIPQQKQLTNGKHNTLKEKKKTKPTDEDAELMTESDENETDNSNEELNENSDNSDAEESNEAADESDEENENETNTDKPVKNVLKMSAKDKKFGVFVAGLDYKLGESDIRKIFDNTNILSIVLLRNSITNKSKGSGFINFKDEASVKKALLKNGTELHGRKLRVNLPLDKNTQKTLLLKKLKSRVQKLEEELSTTGQKINIRVKPTNNGNKKGVKQE